MSGDAADATRAMPTHGGELPPRALNARELKAVIEAERRGAPFLLHRDGGGELVLRELVGERLTIGRSAAAELCFSWDPSVSSVHAELLPLGSSWLIADEGISRNGTFVNGERVGGRQRLRDGDVVRVGRTALVFHERAPVSLEATITVDDGPAARVTDAQRRVLVALCRPYQDGSRFATPAPNAAIAGELFLSVEAVKTHLRGLYQRFGLDHLPQNEKRVRLAERALALGLATARE